MTLPTECLSLWLTNHLSILKNPEILRKPCYLGLRSVDRKAMSSDFAGKNRKDI